MTSKTEKACMDNSINALKLLSIVTHENSIEYLWLMLKNKQININKKDPYS